MRFVVFRDCMGGAVRAYVRVWGGGCTLGVARAFVFVFVCLRECVSLCGWCRSVVVCVCVCVGVNIVSVAG